MKRQEILIIVVPGFIFVILWLVFNIFHQSVTSTISEDVSIQISPIKADFNLKEIENLKNRQQVTPLYEAFSQNSSIPTSNIETPVISSPSGGNTLP